MCLSVQRVCQSLEMNTNLLTSGFVQPTVLSFFSLTADQSVGLSRKLHSWRKCHSDRSSHSVCLIRHLRRKIWSRLFDFHSFLTDQIILCLYRRCSSARRTCCTKVASCDVVPILENTSGQKECLCIWFRGAICTAALLLCGLFTGMKKIKEGQRKK